MANRNRTAGHDYERKIVNEMKHMGFSTAVTSRSESRNLDNLGIDIFDTDGKMYHDIQCKVSKNLNSKKIREFINRGREDKRLIIFHKHVERIGNKFMPRGEFVYMNKDTYYEMLNQIENLSNILSEILETKDLDKSN